jgi:ribosomal protein L12E/L44/L45/RPP1/RPP2
MLFYILSRKDLRTNELEVADGYLLQSNFAAWCASCALNTSCPNSSNSKKKKKEEEEKEKKKKKEEDKEKEKK